MMGDGLPPMPSQAAVPPPATGTAPSATPAAGAQGARAAQQGRDAANDPQGDASADAFSLLLAALPTAATPASSAAPSGDTGSAGESDPRNADAPATSGADPLLVVLAQLGPLALAPAASTPAPANDPMRAVQGDAQPGATPVSGMPGAALPSLASRGATATDIDASAPASAAAVAPSTQAPLDDPAKASASPAAPAAAFELPQATASAHDAATLPQPHALAQVAPATPTHAPMPAAPSAPAQVLAQPADPAAGYDDGFATQVSWLAEQRIGQAEIRISPEHLGAIDIRLQLDGREVRAEFHSQHAEVRQALEASLPRLRDLLGQHGLQLAHAGVGQERRPQSGMPLARTSGNASQDERDAPRSTEIRRARGLLDVYA